MRKTGRKARMEEMSAGRIEYLEAARRRVNNRRLRRTALLVRLSGAEREAPLWAELPPSADASPGTEVALSLDPERVWVLPG